MRLRLNILIFIYILFIAADLSASTSRLLTIVASGETHALLYPCDCQLEPYGGLGRRATAIQKLRDSTEILLLDAGGFSAGGIYDTYTEGRFQDSLRTIATISAMGKINYDGVGVGDEELIYHPQWLSTIAKEASLPLISANCEYRDQKLAFEPYRIIRKAGLKIGITAVTTQEVLFPLNSSVIVTEPFAALKRFWKLLKTQSDVQIVLSHLGESDSRKIVDSFPGCIVVNAHRKETTVPYIQYRRGLIINFGFQGKHLAHLKIGCSKDSIFVVSGQWLDMAEHLQSDPAIDSLIAHILSARLDTISAIYDLYIMAQCPFGLEALKEFLNFTKSFPQLKWNVWFIGIVDENDKLHSLRGNSEIADEMLWLAIQALYPSAWTAFLTQRSLVAPTKIPTETLVVTMGMNMDSLKTWVKDNGFKELSLHYRRSMRLGINSSPTLLKNNSPLTTTITKDYLARYLCTESQKKAAPYCDSLPQCLDDTHCRKEGKIGLCVKIEDNKKNCVFIDDTPFTLRIVVADSAVRHPQDEIIRSIRDLFPASQIAIFPLSSDSADALLRLYDPAALPFFVFDKSVTKAYNFSKIENSLIEKNGILTFNTQTNKNNYFYKRKLDKGRIDLYVDPFLPSIGEILQLAIKNDSINIYPMIFEDPSSNFLTAEQRLRHQEAHRWLTLEEINRKKYNSYLLSYCNDPGSSYWFINLKKIGIKQERFIRQISNSQSKLTELWSTINELGIVGPVTLLIDNREVVVVKNRIELEQILRKKLWKTPAFLTLSQ